ncbi:MAG: hypothetical protein AAF587_31795 [Bacteroidota bacterium]
MTVHSLHWPPLFCRANLLPGKHIWTICWVGVILFVSTSLFAQPSTELLLPVDKHLPQDLRTQSIYDKSGTKVVAKFQYYYDHWSEKQIKHGLYTRWDKHGNTRLEMEFDRGELIHKVTRNAKGERVKESQWLHGRLAGMQRQYNVQNRLCHEIHYTDGKKEGLEKRYYSSGGLKWVRIFHKGKQQGPKVRYHKDGSLKQKIKSPKESEQSMPPKVEVEQQSEHSQLSSKS